MKKLLLIICIALVASACQKQKCEGWVDLEIIPDTDIKRLNIHIREGLGIVKFTDTSIIAPAYVGYSILLSNSHERDTVTTVTVGKHKYEIKAQSTIEIPVLCQ